MNPNQSTPTLRDARLVAFGAIGWKVRDVDAVATALEAQGVSLER